MDIYDEDEEMISTIGIENEEVSEDDIGFESEYERMMEEYNESDEYEGDRGDNENESEEDDKDETSEEASDEEEIIDQPFNNEQMPYYALLNEFAPYFNNITESLFFCWMQKHRICKLHYFNAYKRNYNYNLQPILH